MIASTDRGRRARTSSFSMLQIIDYWRDNWEPTFPDLPASHYGWGEPFCFHCGWMVPDYSELSKGNPWANVGGWLERAHLQDYGTGGADIPANIVPLCALCHRIMPSFPSDPAPAIAWVKATGHVSCPPGWQEFTDRKWGSDPERPGRSGFVTTFVRWQEQRASAIRAAEAFAHGQQAKAFELAQLAGVPRATAKAIFDKYVEERALEVSAA